MNKPKLIPCPFCGKVETVEYTNAGECGACAKASLDNTCCDFEPEGCSMVAVVCNVNRGGCGASSGYAFSFEGAAKKWNARAGLDETHDLLCTMHKKHGGTCDSCPMYDEETADCYKKFESLVIGT